MRLNEARVENDNGLAFLALQGLMDSAMRSNVDAMGYEKGFIELNRTFEHNAKWAVIHASRTAGRDADGIQGLLTLLHWYIDMCYRPEFYYGTEENGSLLLVCTGCRHAGIYPLNCEGFCRYEFIFMCEESNPELELDLRESLMQGDDRCSWLIKRKDGGRILEEDIPYQRLDIASAPAETKDYWAMAGAGEFFTQATASLVRSIGPQKALALLLKNCSRFGRELGTYMSMKGEASRFPTMVDLIHFLDDLFRIEGSPSGHDGLEDESIISSCPFRDSPIECCKQIEAYKIEVAKALFPGKEFTFNEERGESTCKWTLRLKGPVQEREQMIAKAKEDPMERLMNRMIDGEISEEEFERKMALLKKHGLQR